MAINKLEELRKTGNFTPKKSFNESIKKETTTTEKSKKNKQDIQEIETTKYVPSTNQRKTLKVSPQTKAEVEELKRQLKMGFNYEVIQYLIDNYVDTNLSPSQKRRFRENTEN